MAHNSTDYHNLKGVFKTLIGFVVFVGRAPCLWRLSHDAITDHHVASPSHGRAKNNHLEVQKLRELPWNHNQFMASLMGKMMTTPVVSGNLLTLKKTQLGLAESTHSGAVTCTSKDLDVEKWTHSVIPSSPKKNTFNIY